ncbi:MAG: alpha/beta fold hydrolase [Granulosicoccaceae bacterium]
MNETWVASGSLVADGKALEYSCLGPSPTQAPTLVMLHEGLGCTSLWRDVPATLADSTGFGVFVYSRAGYGLSDPADLPRPLDYMTREALDVLPVMLDAIGVKQTVILGHSDGATITAIHAGRVVDPRISGIVLVAPHFFTEPASLAEITKAREGFDSGDLRQRLAKYHCDPDNAFRGWNDSWLNPAFKKWNVADVLDAIRVPVLAIQGREDPYGTLAQINVVKQRVKHARVSTLILDGCKHAPHLEYESAFVNAVTDFCNRLTLDLSNIQLPSHAHIPGHNMRHPENAFDRIRQTAARGQSADQLACSDAYRAGLRFLNAGFYWEAHEALEPVWMVLPEKSMERRFVRGLIQLANGRLKMCMGRPKAALRLVVQARDLVPTDSTLAVMTLDVQDVHGWIDELEGDACLAL